MMNNNTSFVPVSSAQSLRVAMAWAAAGLIATVAYIGGINAGQAGPASRGTAQVVTTSPLH